MYAIALLAIANILDVLTGFIGALEQKTLSSKSMKHGMVSKLFIWVMVGVGYVLKFSAGTYLNIDFDPVPFIVAYYLIMELVSILENVSDYLPVPQKIKNLLEQTDEAQEQSKYVPKHKGGKDE